LNKKLITLAKPSGLWAAKKDKAVQEKEFRFKSDADGLEIAAVKWMPEGGPKAVVQIAHGLAEHCRRYKRFAEALIGAGYAAYAYDHRGHGETLTDGATPGDFGAASWDGLVADMAQMTAIIRDENPDLPVILFGHSMGSFAAQTYLLDRSDKIDACILSGSSDMPSLAQMAMSGADMSFAAFNAAFEPVRTDFDWLSRDEAEVDAYIADPLCGFDAPPETAMAMFASAARIADPAQMQAITSALPILIASGRADPLADGGALLESLARRYGEGGVQRVDVTLYDGARHEILNETNRNEVTADILKWAGQVMAV